MSKLKRFRTLGLLALAMLALVPVGRVLASKYAQGDVVGHQFTFSSSIPSALAADATIDYVIFWADRDEMIRSVDCAPRAAVTGVATNNRAFLVFNRSTDGSGSTQLGSTLTLAAGTNLTAYKNQNLYAPTTPTNVAAGTVLSLENALNGTGLATPYLTCTVTYSLQ